MDAGDQLFAPQHADAMARTGQANLIAGGAGIEHLVPRLERDDLGPDEATTIPLLHCAASLTGTISPLGVSVSSSGWTTR